MPAEQEQLSRISIQGLRALERALAALETTAAELHSLVVAWQAGDCTAKDKLYALIEEADATER